MHTDDDVVVTPAQATYWLEHHNGPNRLIKSNKVEAYSRDMLAGRWRVTGESIKFDEQGNLVDGQHRLYACALSGVAFTTTVQRGVDRAAQEVMDSGIMRGAADMLSMRGISMSRNVAASARVLRGYLDTHGVRIDHYLRNSLTTNSEIDTVLAHNPGLVEIASQSVKWTRMIGITGSVGSVAMYLLTRVDEAEAKEFFESLTNHTTDGPGDPRYALLRRLALSGGNTQTGRHHLSQGEQLSMVIRAWNAWRRGATMTKMQTTSGGYHVPIPRPV